MGEFMSDSILNPNAVCQVALVVKDIDKASEKYAQLFGVPKPDYIVTDELDKARTTYRDRPSPAQAKLAFFDLGKLRLELIEPLGEPSTWLDGLQANGESFHHLAFMVEDTQATVKAFEQQGVPVVQQGYYEGGMYTYVDSQEKYGVVFELLQDL
jgi:catechol 2,3-dioxygenase-like lactoylglutathione lyase family enzyme